MVLLTWDIWSGRTMLYSALWCYCGIQDLHHTPCSEVWCSRSTDSRIVLRGGRNNSVADGHLPPSPYNWCAPSTAWQNYISTVFLVLYDNVQRTSPPNLTVLVLQSHDCSCYVSRRTLAPPPLWIPSPRTILPLARLVTSSGARYRYLPLKLEIFWN